MLYTTHELMGVRKHLPQRLVPYWSGFVKRKFFSTKDKIMLDEVAKTYALLAPFVSPKLEGVPFALAGFKTLEFAPAYLKPKYVLDYDRLESRLPGEAIGGSMTMDQRRGILVAEGMDLIEASIETRLEWMCAKAMIDCGYSVNSEWYPNVDYVDFGRDPSLDLTLTGGATWDQPTSDAFGDIFAMRKQVKEIEGTTITNIVFGTEAWQAFYLTNEAKLKDLMDTNIRGSNTEVTRIMGLDDIEYVGTISGMNGMGAIRCYVYSGKAKNTDGATENLLDPRDVVGVGNSGLVAAYGKIMDQRANFKPYERFPIFLRPNPHDDLQTEAVVMHCAPLIVPALPNDGFRMRVLA